MKTEMEFEDELKKIICELHQAEMEQLPSKDELQGKYRLSDTFYHKMQRLIRRQKRRKKIRTCAGYVAAAAAVIVLLFSVSHPQYLIEAKNKFMEWFDDHVEFHFKEETGLTGMPKYELGYVPKGYELVEDNYLEMGMGLIVYSNGEVNLALEYELSDANANTNNEDVTFSVITGNNGDTIYYFSSEDMGRESTMTWLSEDENISFTIIGVLSKEEMLKMQESVRICE